MPLQPIRQIAVGRVRWHPHAQGFGARLLYPAATGLEKAMADADAERLLAIPAEIIKDVWDPFRIPIRLLPYLAWAMGVNYWDDNWSETTKRAWVALQWEFKSKRGTRAGIEMMVDYAGRDVTPFGYRVTKVITRPQGVFPGKSMSREERESWLANLPQVRVWRVQESAPSPRRKRFYAARNTLRRGDARFCLNGYAVSFPSDAITRLRRRARWVVDGVETDTTITEFGNYWQLHLPAYGGRRFFLNRPPSAHRFFYPSDAWRRLVTIQPTPLLAWRSPVTPTLEPVNAEPERVFVSAPRGPGVFLGVPQKRHTVWTPSTAYLRIFERYPVVGTDNTPRPMRHVQFAGVGFWGFPKYTAWVSVSLGSKRHRLSAGVGTLMVPKQRFFLPHDQRPTQRAIAAVKASRRMADRILLDLGAVNRWTAGGRPFLAEIDSLIVGRP